MQTKLVAGVFLTAAHSVIPLVCSKVELAKGYPFLCGGVRLPVMKKSEIVSLKF